MHSDGNLYFFLFVCSSQQSLKKRRCAKASTHDGVVVFCVSFVIFPCARAKVGRCVGDSYFDFPMRIRASCLNSVTIAFFS